MPDADQAPAELAKAESMDDFCSKDGIFAKRFASTFETRRTASQSITGMAPGPTLPPAVRGSSGW